MTLRRNIKSQARLALDGSWGQARAILLMLITFNLLINIVDSSVMGLLGYEFQFGSLTAFIYSDSFFYDPVALLFSPAVWVIRLIIISPLSVGMVNWYRQLTDRRRMGISHTFCLYETKAWLSAGWLSLTVWLRVTLLSVVLLPLPLMLIVIADDYLHLPVIYSMITAAGIVLLLFVTLLLVVFSKRYSMAAMLLGENYNMTAGEARKTSVRYTKGHCFELVMVDLSFLPWVLPLIAVVTGLVLTTSVAYDPFSVLPLLLGSMAVLIAIVTLFKLYPYYTMTTLMYSRYLYEHGCHCEQGTAATAVAAPPPAPEQAQPAQPTNNAGGVHWQDITD